MRESLSILFWIFLKFFEPRDLKLVRFPRSLAAAGPGFAFYVADPPSSIRA